MNQFLFFIRLALLELGNRLLLRRVVMHTVGHNLVLYCFIYSWWKTKNVKCIVYRKENGRYYFKGIWHDHSKPTMAHSILFTVRTEKAIKENSPVKQ